MPALTVWLALTTFSAALAMVPVDQAPSDSHARDRAKVMATFERLIVTGEPRHTDHDDGQWLQRAVDAAVRRNDTEIIRMAQRAAVLLVPRITRPVSSVSEPPGISIETPAVLKLPSTVPHSVEILVSLDGGSAMRLPRALHKGGRVGLVLSEAAERPGLHHVRLQAHITYLGAEGSVPPPESRNLREVIYAIYDPVSREADSRTFGISPAAVSARKLDPALPEVPFGDWLNGVLRRYGASSNPQHDWHSAYCDERVLEAGAAPRSPGLCTVAYFGGGAVIGQMWFRTGRVEFSNDEVRWLAETPSFEGALLQSGRTTQVNTLSGLATLLDRAADSWPTGDVSIAAADIEVTPGPGTVRVDALVRNNGSADLYGVFINMMTTTSGERHDTRSFVRDIPRGGQVRIQAVLALPAAYGTVMLHAMQLGEHNPLESWMADPTPDDSLAFRLVNPRLAPSKYLGWIRDQCGYICFGF